MKFKKLLASSLLCGLCIFSSIPVHASEVEGPVTGIQRTEHMPEMHIPSRPVQRLRVADTQTTHHGLLSQTHLL